MWCACHGVLPLRLGDPRARQLDQHEHDDAARTSTATEVEAKSQRDPADLGHQDGRMYVVHAARRSGSCRAACAHRNTSATRMTT